MEEQEIQQLALQVLGLVFNVQTDNLEELTKEVQTNLGKIPKKNQETLVKESMAVAQGVASGKITKEQLPTVINELKKTAGMDSALVAKLGAKLNYINKLNKIRR